MRSDEIRETYLAFFEQRGHLRIPSASLVPPADDRSVLLTTAGMQQFKPYFLGLQTPPHTRLTSCQKVFRAVDIDQVGLTARHLTTFEMLGNFSIGDYFKQGAVEFAWELSLQGFGLKAQDIWITVFEGDERLGLGPDEEAIDAWLAVGVPRERIVLCPRSENYWQAGPTGPSGPCSELYLDRGVEFGAPDDLPGGDNERFLEYWNLVFMQYNQDPPDHLEPLPSQNIDTGLGLNRMAAILQQKPSVFETDQFWPLIELGQELSGAHYGSDFGVDRAMRILADHTRGAAFLVADGVVPSNEDRGYVLRRIMRRAIQQGRTLGLGSGFLTLYANRVEEIMGDAYPELREQREAIQKWLAAEEEGFGRTLEQGTRLLDQLAEQALIAGDEGIAAQDAFMLHDTYGFPFDLTRELLTERGLGVDEDGFEALMDEQRQRARAAGGGSGQGAVPGLRDRAREFADSAGAPTRFTGYETERQATIVEAVGEVSEDVPATSDEAVSTGAPAPGRLLVKLSESPFYAAGGGQISDHGLIECEHGACRARVEDVLRLGDDQVLVVSVEAGALAAGERVVARVDHAARHATECNHTATHLLHAALRARLGAHVHQAGSHVGPDKLRFDFSHSQALTAEELHDVEEQVNAWILRNDRVHPIITSLEEAKRLGAMALFGEKYGEIVRVVEVGEGDYSRELCGGTHVDSTAQIGLFRIISETSSAANVRRIEALTGPEAVTLLRHHDDLLHGLATRLRTTPEGAGEALELRERQRRELEQRVKQGDGAGSASNGAELASHAEQVGGAQLLASVVEVSDAKALLDLADRAKGRLGDAAIVLGTAVDGRVHLVAIVAPSLVARGVRAGEIVKVAAELVGGGGGGRDTMAQAGGRDPSKLDDAIAAARDTVKAALAG
jgi:alanyl-tRNA synthetase